MPRKSRSKYGLDYGPNYPWPAGVTRGRERKKESQVDREARFIVGMEKNFPGWGAKRAEEAAVMKAATEARRAAEMAQWKRFWMLFFDIFIVAPFIVALIFAAIIILGFTLAVAYQYIR